MPTAAYLAYVARKEPPPRLLTVLEVALPQGTLYLSEVPFDRYEARIKPGTISSVKQSVSPDSTTIGATRLDVTVSDGPDRRIEKLLEGAYEVKRSVGILKRASPDLVEADWLTRYTGLLDSWDWHTSAPGTVTLHFRPDDQALRNSWAPGVPILKSEWGEGSYVMPDGVSGTYAPFLYGSHNSAGLSGWGFIPLICVGQTGTTGRYLVSRGRVMAKTGTWKTSDRGAIAGTLEVVVRGGKTFSTVNFGAGVTAGLEIWGDFDGYETIGDGTGTLVTNPVRQLRHLLAIIYADWRLGNWPALTVAPVHAPSWEACADWCDRFKIEGSAYLGGTKDKTKAQALIDKWLQSFPLFRLFWNEQGLLEMVNFGAALDWPGYPSALSMLFDAPSRGGDRRPRVPQDVGGLARQVSATYLFDAAQGENHGTLDVQDPSVSELVVSNVVMDWSLSRAA